MLMESRKRSALRLPRVKLGLLPTLMSDYDASSRDSAFRRCKRERIPGPRLRRFALGATSRSAETFLGTGSGDRCEVFQGDSGLLEGGVRLADETA